MLRGIRGAVLPLCVLLAGCSGGGGGGGVDSTPPPPPPPAQDPPSNANSSLLNLNSSETFTNDAASGTVHFASVGNALTRSSTAGKSTLKIVYDAASQTYRIDVAGRSQTFRPGDIDPSQDNAGSKTYKRVSGNTTDNLTLTKPGTSGPLTYQYVGAGFWQRVVQTSQTVIDGSFDAFTYGVETPDASLPRTGAAHYGIDLIGVAAPQTTTYLLGIAGSGDMSVDFQSGLIQLQGTANELDATTNTINRSGVTFSGNGQISSSVNSFTGNFHYGFDFDPAGTYNGSLDGRFYGPTAQEVGATYYAKASDGSSSVGTITGRQDNAASAALNLVNLQGDKSFVGDATGITYNLITSPPPYTTLAPGFTTIDSTSSPIGYTKASDSFTVSGVTFAPASKTGTDSKFTNYHVVDGTTSYDLQLYKPGAGNGELALSYTSLGIWRQSVPDPGGSSSAIAYKYFAYGLPTPLASVPTSGSGHFAGVLYGSAIMTAAPGNAWTLTGTAVLDWNFQTRGVTGTLTPVGTDIATNATRNFGALTFTEANGGSAPTDFQVHLFSSASDVGEVSARLYGPNAEEVGGAFHAQLPDNQTPGVFYNLAGAYVAKR